MNIYATDPSVRHTLQKGSSRAALVAFDLLQTLFPITLVVSPCLAAFTFMSSVMGSLKSEPLWLSLMHAAVVVEMPLVIACTVENRFVQQEKPPSSIAQVTRIRQMLIYAITALWCLTSLTALLARPSCAEGASWLASLTPRVLLPGAKSIEQEALENCHESLLAVGLSVVNAVLCLCPVVCTIIVKYALYRIDAPHQTSTAPYEILPQQAPC
ncbi:hypothetical protein CALVIDRAFT_597212 [Calocera viscosa TUFC12733]|uniref:Uncharacterized protein n=1 Tax=Calocera viscosa (strain TUFC12733) TaxID=1330018 RepID=A0A167NHL2_CALVF|nr:hypothetical protein CALVIDRAFT_597212 [Calocera viscosa TUFC12733]